MRGDEGAGVGWEEGRELRDRQDQALVREAVRTHANTLRYPALVGPSCVWISRFGGQALIRKVIRTHDTVPPFFRLASTGERRYKSTWHLACVE